MSEAAHLMPIGRFARSCRLTIKALRHYDAEGLLLPAHVDPTSGYRYYARSQARDAILIGMLRGLGVGLPSIRAILDADEHTRTALLESEAARLEREIELRRQALASLRRIAHAGDLLPYEVRVRHEAPLLVAERRIATTADRLIPDTTEAVYGLLASVRAAGRDVLMPVLCMNEYDDAEDRITVRACAAVRPPPPQLKSARVVELPGGEFAVRVHRGPYEELPVAYHALHAWVQEHGHEEAGAVREVYRNDPADVAPAELLTELLLPIR